MFTNDLGAKMKEPKRSSFAFMLQAHGDLFGYWLKALAFTL